MSYLYRHLTADQVDAVMADLKNDEEWSRFPQETRDDILKELYGNVCERILEKHLEKYKEPRKRTRTGRRKTVEEPKQVE
jgi:acyl-CoA reductase-like NAD-dependent aldehyde dehydrogenase